MKLFVSPGACSLAPHIVLHELEMKHDIEKVDMKTKKTVHGDFNKINPKSYVPALELDNGEILTEGTAIMQYLADQKPDAKLIPKMGTWERYRAIEWLNFVATEIHKGMANLWHPEAVPANAQDQFKTFFKDKLAVRFDLLDKHLSKNKFMMGDQFTVVDAYLYTIVSWTKILKLDMTKWPKLMGFIETVGTRPSVMKAHDMEKKYA
jgi:glutathione S-transferase